MIIHIPAVMLYSVIFCTFLMYLTRAVFWFNRQLVKSVTLFLLGIYVAREVAAAEASAPDAVPSS